MSIRIWIAGVGIVAASIAIASISKLQETKKQHWLNTQSEELDNDHKRRESCSTKFVNVEMGEFEFRLPRDGFHVFIDRDTVVELQEDSNCEIKAIRNATGIWSWQLGLSDPRQDSRYADGYQTTYSMFQKTLGDIDKYQSSLSSRIERIRSPIDDVFLLPFDQSPTGNKQRVLLRCEGREETMESKYPNYCETKYLHPQGFLVSYWFNRTGVTRDEFVSVDHGMRARIRDLMINGVKKE